MDNSLFVRSVECVSDLERDIDYSCDWQRSFISYNLFERPATEKFHHEEDVSTLVLAKISNTNRIRM